MTGFLDHNDDILQLIDVIDTNPSDAEIDLNLNYLPQEEELILFQNMLFLSNSKVRKSKDEKILSDEEWKDAVDKILTNLLGKKFRNTPITKHLNFFGIGTYSPNQLARKGGKISPEKQMKGNRYTLKKCIYIDAMKIFPWLIAPRFRQSLSSREIEENSSAYTIEDLVEALNFFLLMDYTEIAVNILRRCYEEMEIPSSVNCLSTIVDVYRMYKSIEQSHGAHLKAPPESATLSVTSSSHVNLRDDEEGIADSCPRSMERLYKRRKLMETMMACDEVISIFQVSSNTLTTSEEITVTKMLVNQLHACKETMTKVLHLQKEA